MYRLTLSHSRSTVCVKVSFLRVHEIEAVVDATVREAFLVKSCISRPTVTIYYGAWFDELVDDGSQSVFGSWKHRIVGLEKGHNEPFLGHSLDTIK